MFQKQFSSWILRAAFQTAFSKLSEWDQLISTLQRKYLSNSASSYLHIIEEPEVAGCLRCSLNSLGQCNCSFTSLCPVSALHSIKRSCFLCQLYYKCQFSLCICSVRRKVCAFVPESRHSKLTVCSNHFSLLLTTSISCPKKPQNPDIRKLLRGHPPQPSPPWWRKLLLHRGTDSNR